MFRLFRDQHLLNLLQSFDKFNKPIDFVIASYFKQHKALGSKDRKELSERAYFLIRNKALIDFNTPSPCTWEKRLEIALKLDFNKLQSDESIPLFIRLNIPKALYPFLKEGFSDPELIDFCLHSNEKAPVTLRTNSLKISRDELYEKLTPLFPLRKTLFSPLGLTLEQNQPLFALEEFKQGFYEVQDEGSQLVGLRVLAKPKDQVLDFCSGSGGKTLAFAPYLQHQGQIYLHDIRPWALLEAKKRLHRAGIQNAQIVRNFTAFTQEKREKIDWVLVDAPCSGTGTYRRNPDMKWRFAPSGLENLLQEQRSIFHEALSFVKPGGHIVYATCSVLKRENQDQVDFFLSQYSLSLVEPPFQSVPKPNQMDGFFSATFKKS